MNRSIILAVLILLCGTEAARAGMTVYDLSDLVRLRLEDISFFTLLLALSSVSMRFLWNFLARDFPVLPHLSYRKAFSLTLLLGLLMLLALIMIAGARELLTPGAWHRQGSHYRPNDLGNQEMRQQSIVALRASLQQYAETHHGQFPPHDYVAELPEKIWQTPDTAGSRYVYVGGLNRAQSNSVMALEPATFGLERLVLRADGNIEKMKQEDIVRLLGKKESSR